MITTCINSTTKTPILTDVNMLQDPRLTARGITPRAAEYAGIHRNGRGWLYPISPDVTGERWKAFEGSANPKYLWKPTQPDNARLYDPRGQLAAHIAAAGGVLILASGDPDSWVCFSAGIFNATCTLHGEGTIPRWFVETLIALKVQTVRLWPDRDAAGLRHAAKIAAALEGSGIAVEIYALPYADQSKADLNTLWLDCGQDRDRFIAALESCPMLDIPNQESPPPTQRHESTPPAEYATLYEQWCLEIERAAMAAWNISPSKKDEWSRTNFRSPLREDRHPSARWNYDKHGFKDFATGEFYNTAYCADLLGMVTWEAYKADHAPTVVKKPSHTPTDTATTPSRFPGGLPFTVDKMLTIAHRLIDNIDKQGDVAALLYLWHDIPETMIPGGVWVKWGDLFTAAANIDRPTKRHFLETALKKALQWGIVDTMPSGDLSLVPPDDPDFKKICEKCNLINGEVSIYRLQKSQIFFNVSTLRANTRPTTLYRFKPWPEMLAAIAQYHRYHQRERVFRFDADTVQPEWGDLTDEQIAAWNEYRAPVYDADHHKALATFEKHMAYLENAIGAIERGTNWVITLPPGPIGSARDYRILKAQARTADTDIERGKLARDLGVDRSTLARDYDRIGVIPIPQTKVIAAAAVSDYQRDNGLVIQDFNNGMVEVKAPSLLRSVERASEDDKATFADLRSQQAERRNLRTDIETARLETLRHVTEHDPDLYPPPEKSLTIPGNYTDDHKRNQYNLFPLPADFPGYDLETGEVATTIDNLWRAGAIWLLARERGGTMPTFTVHAEPHDSEDRLTCENADQGDPLTVQNDDPEPADHRAPPAPRERLSHGYHSLNGADLLHLDRPQPIARIDGLPYYRIDQLAGYAARYGVEVESLIGVFS